MSKVSGTLVILVIDRTCSPSKIYRADLFLRLSTLIPKNHSSRKFLEIMTTDGKILWDLITTIKSGRPLWIHGIYRKNHETDFLHVKDDHLFMDNKLFMPAAVLREFSSMLHKMHPGQFGMKFSAIYIWWPHTVGNGPQSKTITPIVCKPANKI